MSESTMLVKVSTTDNNNKFYEVTLDASGHVSTRWGRVGADGQRGSGGHGPSAYQKVIASKERKGYVRVDVVGTGGGTGASTSDLLTVARKRVVLDAKDAMLDKLVASWCAANRHRIETTSGGVMSVSATGAVSTPVGVVSAASIAQARVYLADMLSTTGRDQVRLVERYLSLVPQDVGRNRGWEEGFVRPERLAKQADFLDQLDGSVAMATAVSGDSDVDAEFRYGLTRIDPADAKFADAQRRFSSTRNQMHTSSGLRLTGLYAIVHSNPAEPVTWKGKADTPRNVKRLWHGTRDFNLLSILHRGLYVPPSHGGGTAVVTGRMFGDGVYFSDQSTKSLNYSQGYWGGGPRQNHCFMFLADCVMGKTYTPSGPGNMAASRSGGYHSITALGGKSGVVNNEMIVWDTDQIRLSYLCEFSG